MRLSVFECVIERVLVRSICSLVCLSVFERVWMSTNVFECV